MLELEEQVMLARKVSELSPSDDRDSPAMPVLTPQTWREDHAEPQCPLWRRQRKEP